MKNFILIIFVALMTFSCASGGGISTGALTAVMSGTEKAGDDIVEASIAKELAVMNTLKNRDIEYGKAYALSGFKLTFRLVVIAGVKMYLPASIEYKPEPKFTTPLPTKPSVHPVWETTRDIFAVMAKYGLIAYGLHELNSMVSSGYASSGSVYNGPVIGSGNTAGGAQTIGIMRDYSIITETTNNIAY